MQKFYTLLLILFSVKGYTQTAVTAYTIVNDVPSTASYTNFGWNTSGEYNNTTSYTNFYGQQNGGAAGIERRVTGFSIGALSYSAILCPGGLPYDNIIINRHPSLPGDTINTLYEYSTTAGNNLYHEPSYLPTLEGVINSLVCNRGSDNTFSNRPITQANIERIDEIITAGIVCTSPSKQGFLINERNGDDNFKVAAITTLSGGIVTELGSLLNVPAATWGVVGPAFVSRVMSKDIETADDADLRPNQDISLQTVSGVFISFADLGISAGTAIYGISVFPNDVTAAMNLITLSNVPTDTDAGANGGLDMMAGGGFFVENTILPHSLISFSGKVTGSDIMLAWKASNQNNFSRFELERSLDEGNNFEKIANITSGNTTSGDYYFTDRNVFQQAGKTYLYRLTMFHSDGSFLYSNTVAFRFSKTETFMVFPNMVNRAQPFNIEITGTPNLNKYDVAIIDIAGRTKKIIKQLQNGRYSVDTGELVPGIYFVKFVSDKMYKSVKLIIK